MSGEAPARSSSYRPEIQGVRAVAAILVAVYHLFIGRVSGGVDVFFVISGFLITGTLFGHYRRYGRVRPLVYLGRLGRRLLPAALTVLAAVLIASWLFLPHVEWGRIASEITASALYYENWQLAFSAVDYLAGFDGNTPVQHFWAMSIQGQFYVIWLLVFLVVGLLGRGDESRRRSAALWIFAGLFVASLAWSVVWTAINQPFAYFDTSARVWEFALGGLAAILIPKLRIAAWLRGALGWVGLAAIISCGILLPVSDSFPGAIALWPTVAALLILVAGTGGPGRGSAAWLLGRKPFVWLGDISYGIYLWHWPMLAGYLAVTGRSRVPWTIGVGILVASIVLAWATNRLVERPIQRSTRASAKAITVRVVGATAVTALIVGGAATGRVSLDRQIEQSLAQVQQLLDDPPDDPCWGAAALANGCDESVNQGEIVPLPIARNALWNGKCDVQREDAFPALRPCHFGADADAADAVVAYVGDSHAQSMRQAMIGVGELRNWHVVDLTNQGCIASQATRVFSTPGQAEVCRAWLDQVHGWLNAHPEATILVTTQASGRAVETADEDWKPVAVQGFLDEWAQLPATITDVVVIRDTPRLPGSSPNCVDRAMQIGADPAASCSRPREDSLQFDPAAEAARTDDSDSTVVVDLTDLLCSAETCAPVIGGIWAYRDGLHLNALFTATLAPYIDEQLDELLGATR